MTATIDHLIAELARLKERVDTLEQSAFAAPSDYVEGWCEVARFLGISGRTCRRRHEAGQFPEPCGAVELTRKDGKNHESPRWRRADLVRYAENGVAD